MNFIYLVQGQAERVERYFHLADRTGCKAFFLSYDRPLEGCIYLPGSTWAEGRNTLLDQTTALDYDYLIYLDDDVELTQGSWNELEEALAKYRPAIAVPLVSKVKRSPVTRKGEPWEYQCFRINDEQCLALHRDTIADRIVVPYVTQFDHLSWWAACEIQQILIQTCYAGSAIQFNKIKVENLIHGRHSTDDLSYKDKIRAWLQAQLKVPLIDIWRYWEDWPGIHVQFELEALEKLQPAAYPAYQTNFRALIARTEQFSKNNSEPSSDNNSPTRTSQKSRFFNSDSYFS